MASGTLTNNTGTITFQQNQVNTITFNTENTFVDSDIALTTKVTKAILTTTSTDTDHKTFQIQVPNGSSSENITFTFTTDTAGNVTID